MSMNTPKLRFSQFTDSWNLDKLIAKVSLYSGLTYTPDDVRSDGTLVLRSSNVQNGEISLLDNVYVNPSVAKSQNVEVGDIIVVVRNGSRALIGKHAQIKSSMLNTVIGAFMTGIRSGYPNFMNALLSSGKFGQEVEKNLGATINQITNATFNSMEFFYPNDEEQIAIGDFFTSLDSMISLTSKKIEKLKQTLTGCMQTMFPQEGELEPKIRFKGFKGEWKVLRIGDISKSIKRVVPNSKAPIMMITAQNGFINQSDRYSFNNAGESLKKYIELRKRELAYNHGASKLRPYGSCFALNVEKARVPFVYHCFAVNDNNDPEFISLVLNNAGVNDQLRKIITSGARMDGLLNISFEEYCSLILQLPSLEEQQRIVTYFNSLSEMISLQTKHLELLKHIKSACLDNMFV